MKIISISAIWCPSCLIMKKVWKKIKEDYKDLEIIEIDYDIDNEEITKYQVGSKLPVIIFLDNDQEVDRIIGEISYENLKIYIDKNRS